MNTEKNNPALGGTWEEHRKEIYTPEEIAQSDLRVMLVGEIVAARTEKGISQRDLAKASGVSQSVIARLETFDTNPTMETVLKILTALGKSLYIGDLYRAGAS